MVYGGPGIIGGPRLLGWSQLGQRAQADHHASKLWARLGVLQATALLLLRAGGHASRGLCISVPAHLALTGSVWMWALSQPGLCGNRCVQRGSRCGVRTTWRHRMTIV